MVKPTNHSNPGIPIGRFWFGLFSLIFLIDVAVAQDATGSIRKETTDSRPVETGVYDNRFEFSASVIDRTTERPIYSRVYLKDGNGKHYTVESSAKNGQAIPYRIERGSSREIHTTLSNHPFRIDLKPGKYWLTVEHGKEYLSETIQFNIVDRPVKKTIRLRRWVDMSARGWYSGEVHLHRKLVELPTVMQAEDLNVALPLTYWVTDSLETPARHNRSGERSPQAKLIRVSDRHLIWPVNTEYEIFSLRRKRHTLGAFFVLNHKKPLDRPVPPAKPVVDSVRSHDVLIDLDKHNWPWSLMLVPRIEVDLFELSNNHVWPTPFHFSRFHRDTVPKYMGIQTDSKGGFTEWGWIDFGFQTYYALLNCGFRIMPSAGTASGVHPVPAGFGRVYVYLPDGLKYGAWVQGLKQGHSFVTNGPILDAKIDGKISGTGFNLDNKNVFRIDATAEFPQSSNARLEIIVNGKPTTQPALFSATKDAGILILKKELRLRVDEPSWVCVRCIQELDNGKIAFAHTAPWFFAATGKKIQPRREEVQFMVRRMEAEIERNRPVFTPEQLEEFNFALQFYRDKLKSAR